MNIINNIEEIHAKKQILEDDDMKTLTIVAHNLYIQNENKISSKKALINKIIYRKYMELLLCLDNNCFGYIRGFLTYEDDINLMKTCKTLRKRIINNNYKCHIHKLTNRIKISNPNFIPKKIKQINKLFNRNGYLEENNKTITIILTNLLSKHNSLYKEKSKKKTFMILINFALERKIFLQNHLDFAQVVYDKLLEYEEHVLLKNFIMEAKDKFKKLGISLE